MKSSRAQERGKFARDSFENRCTESECHETKEHGCDQGLT